MQKYKKSNKNNIKKKLFKKKNTKSTTIQKY